MTKKLPFLLFSALSAMTLVACADSASDDKVINAENHEVKVAKNISDTSKSNCVYDEDKSIMVSQRIKPLGPYQIDDYIAIYGDNVIGIESPTNNLKLPDGLSKGKYVESFGEEAYYELCGDNLEKYPHLELAEVNIPDTSPDQIDNTEEEIEEPTE